ncbi:hypothetical protein ATO3_05430 [Marinibacterium profundimaris]|uniref:Uncharacterized protein n=1 Tax=Marinibacterium profundimaris TaxID=1679460 RepID=A0A225NMH3_9RHOB|nr:hypothetical protein ATO3_05430 [Marinibacterium profundimaris]
MQARDKRPGRSRHAARPDHARRSLGSRCSEMTRTRSQSSRKRTNGAETTQAPPRRPFAKHTRSAHQTAGGGWVWQPLKVASIRHGSAAKPLAGSRGAAPSPTCCSQHNSRSLLRSVITGDR